MAIFPTDAQFVTPITATNSDKLMIADNSDSDNLKSVLPSSIVAAGLPLNTADSLPAGATNLYMSPAQTIKLASIQAGAEVNAVTSVNGQVLAVNLDQDDIPNGATWVRTANDFTDTNVIELNAASNHLTDFNNPHNTTPALIGLGNVTNDEQLSTTPGNFSALVEKSDIQQHLDDLFVIQDSDDNDIIKKVTNKTDLIWKASLCQVWGASINYYRFNFVSSTTYDIRSIVVFGGFLYMCTTNHQSSGSFAADLALGYWTQIGTGGGGGGGVSVTTGAGAPGIPGTSTGDLYIDNVNMQLYIWNGSSWVQYISPLVFPTTTGSPAGAGTIIGEGRFDPANGNIYIWTGAVWVANTSGSGGGINYVTAPTTVGNKIVFSVGVNADQIDESVISYTALPVPTIDMGGVTTTGIQNFDNNYVANYDGSTLNYTQITQNFTDTPNQISCEVGPAFATPYTAPALTQYAEINIDYDNTVDPVVSKTIRTVLDGNTQVIQFVTATDTGSITVSWAAGDITVAITTGTPGYFSFNVVDPLCFYNGVSVNNYQNKIHIHNGDITENTNTYESNTGVTVVNNNGTINNSNMTINNDNSTTTTGGTYNNVTLTNPTIVGSTLSSKTKLETYTALEDIDIDEHVYVNRFFEQATTTDELRSLAGSPGGSAKTFGHAFVNNKKRSIQRITVQYITSSTGGAHDMDVVPSIYAATGTPGAGATTTGGALFTGASVNTIIPNSANVTHVVDYSIPNNTIDVGNYVLQFDMAISPFGGTLTSRVRGVNSPTTDTNFLDSNVANNGVTMAIVVVFTDGTEVVLSDNALNQEYYRYAGQSTETILSGNPIIIKTRGTVNHTGAVEGDTLYVSDTPGLASTTPGTNTAIIGLGIGTDLVSLRQASDLNNEPTVSLSTLTNGTPNGVSEFTAGGGILSYSITSRTGDDRSLSIQQSIDNTNWILLNFERVPLTSAQDGHTRVVEIKPNTWFRYVYSTTSTGSVNIVSTFIPY